MKDDDDPSLEYKLGTDADDRGRPKVNYKRRKNAKPIVYIPGYFDKCSIGEHRNCCGNVVVQHPCVTAGEEVPHGEPRLKEMRCECGCHSGPRT